MCIVVFRRMQTVTNLYISALALSDVVLAMFCIPFQVTCDCSRPVLTFHWFSLQFRAALLQRWDLPEIMCQFCPFMQTLSVGPAEKNKKKYFSEQ